MARPKTKTSAQIHNNYAKKAYDDIRLQVKKGCKEIIRSHAESMGLTLQGYIHYLIQNDMGTFESMLSGKKSQDGDAPAQRGEGRDAPLG